MHFASQIRNLIGFHPPQATLEAIHDRSAIFPETLSPSFSLHHTGKHIRESLIFFTSIRHELLPTPFSDARE